MAIIVMFDVTPLQNGQKATERPPIWRGSLKCPLQIRPEVSSIYLTINRDNLRKFDWAKIGGVPKARRGP